MRIRFEKRLTPSQFMQIATPIASVLLTMLLGAVIFELIGFDGPRAIEARLTFDMVRRAVGTLPETQREVLLLVCVEGLSYRETAETLGLPMGTVMSRLARARLAIARLTEDNKDKNRDDDHSNVVRWS